MEVLGKVQSGPVCLTHLAHGELNLLVDIVGIELCVAEVLGDVEGKFAVLVGLDDAFVRPQRDDSSLEARTKAGEPHLVS